MSDDGKSTSFLTVTGSSVLSYGGLKAWDATGKELALRFVQGERSRIEIEVDDRGVEYPVTVDPVAQQAYLKASEVEEYDRLGWSVAISGDTIVVGAPGHFEAYVFVRNGSGWSQQASLKGPGDWPRHFAHREYGVAVAISGDTIVVGAPKEDEVYVYFREGSSWIQQAVLNASNMDNSEEFGSAVAISGDTIVVGDFGEASSATSINGNQEDDSAPYAGACYVFVRSGTSWSQQAYLKGDNAKSLEYFGFSVAISDDTIVAGSPGNGTRGPANDPNPSNLVGGAFVFVRSGTMWSQQAYLQPSVGIRSNFGSSVAIEDDRLVVGAIFEDSGATGIDGDESDISASNSGAAFVYSRQGSAWEQEAYLKASNPSDEASFGGSVSISGDAVLVGAEQESGRSSGINGDESDMGSWNGAAYLFRKEEGNWNQLAYIKGADPDSGDGFGISVGISGDYMVVGVPRESSSSNEINGDWSDNSIWATGAVFVYKTLGLNCELSPLENGSVSGSGWHDSGNTAPLSAIPDPGYVFDHWTGDASGSDNPFSLLMDSHKTVGAFFIPDTSDADSDGLSAYQEAVIYGTDPNQADSDGDDLPDGYELGLGRFSIMQGQLTWTQASDAAVASGGHLATFTSQAEWDLAMRSLGSNAFNGVAGAWIGATDTVEEGTWAWVTGESFTFDQWADGEPDDASNSDFAEISGSLGASVGEWFDASAGTTREVYLLEIGYPTDPTNSDSDGDGVPDGKEISDTLTNPTLIDSDNNGTPDGAEDPDNDGLTNLEEVTIHGTNPWDSDTDDDGFDDLFEVGTGFDPTDKANVPDSVSDIMTAIEFSFNAANGVSYRIEASPDLIDWETIEEVIIGEGARVDRLYSRRNQAMRHFRVRRN